MGVIRSLIGASPDPPPQPAVPQTDDPAVAEAESAARRRRARAVGRQDTLLTSPTTPTGLRRTPGTNTLLGG